MSADDTSFPASPEGWPDRDWSEYRKRVADGEGSCRAIDAVQRRRRRQAQQSATAAAEADQ